MRFPGYYGLFLNFELRRAVYRRLYLQSAHLLCNFLSKLRITYNFIDKKWLNTESNWCLKSEQILLISYRQKMALRVTVNHMASKINVRSMPSFTSFKLRLISAQCGMFLSFELLKIMSQIAHMIYVLFKSWRNHS